MLCNLLCQPGKLNIRIWMSCGPWVPCGMCIYTTVKSVSPVCHFLPPSHLLSHNCGEFIASQLQQITVIHLQQALVPTFIRSLQPNFCWSLWPTFRWPLWPTFSRTLWPTFCWSLRPTLLTSERGQMILNVANPNQFKLYLETYIHLHLYMKSRFGDPSRKSPKPGNGQIMDR